MRAGHFVAADEALSMAAKSITLVKGPAATGKTFAFRYAPGTVENRKAGRVEIGDKPVTVKLDTPQAIKAGLERTIDGLVGQNYLKVVDGKSSRAEVNEPS